jgi:hypothetical protein
VTCHVIHSGGVPYSRPAVSRRSGGTIVTKLGVPVMVCIGSWREKWINEYSSAIVVGAALHRQAVSVPGS